MATRARTHTGDSQEKQKHQDKAIPGSLLKTEEVAKCYKKIVFVSRSHTSQCRVKFMKILEGFYS